LLGHAPPAAILQFEPLAVIVKGYNGAPLGTPLFLMSCAANGLVIERHR
jgi:hypothetical protein